MKNLFGFGFVLLFVFHTAHSQADVSSQEEALFGQEAQVEIIESIKAPKPVLQILSADQIPIDEDTPFQITSDPNQGWSNYGWEFSDGRKPFGAFAERNFDTPGMYEVTARAKWNLTRERHTAQKQFLVYEKTALLVASEEYAAEIADLEINAQNNGIWLKKIIIKPQSTDLSSEEFLSNELREEIDFIQDADFLMFYTKSGDALQGFNFFWQKLSLEKQFDLAEKLWVVYTSESLDKISRLSRPYLESLSLPYILLTRREANTPVFELADITKIRSKLETRAIEYQILDKTAGGNWLLPLSAMMTYFVTNGVSSAILYLLLAVPFIAFVIAFARQFVGISTLGVFSPLMLAVSFMVLGLQFGAIIFTAVMLVSYLIRRLFERVELMYIPKVSLLLSLLSLSFFFVLWLAVYFETSLNLALMIFPMMVMATISERFVASQSSEGLKKALFNVGETLFVAIVAYGIVQWNWLQDMVLTFPEIVLLPIIGCVWLGRFTGLRLSEYVKFRSLLGDNAQE